MTIAIISMTRLNREPNKQGIKHLAHCTVAIGDLLTLEGCLLVEHPKAGRVIWSPRPDDRSGDFQVGARLGPVLRAGIAEAASRTFDALAINDNQTGPAVSAAVELVRQIEARDAT